MIKPNKPPTQDNIKQVVEMKFPPDPSDEIQLEAYAIIADGKEKVVEMTANTCERNQENQPSRVPVEELDWATAIASGVMFILTRGLAPRPVVPAY